jgi:hypothetical protein
MSFKYRIMVDGKWNFCNNGVELDTLVAKLVRRGERLEEIEIELVKSLPRIEIYHFEMPYPQAYIDHSDNQAKNGGQPGEVQVRLADNHGIWEAAKSLRDALKQLMKSCKINNLPFRIEDYEVVFTDTVRCDAFDANGNPFPPPTPLVLERSA